MVESHVCRAGDVEILSLYGKDCIEYKECTKCCQIKNYFGKVDLTCADPGCEEGDILGDRCDTTEDCKACCALKFSENSYFDPSCYKPECYPKLKTKVLVGESCDTTADCQACCATKFDSYEFNDFSCYTKACHPGYTKFFTVEDGQGPPGSTCISEGPDACIGCCKDKFKNKVIDPTCKECLLNN